MAIFFALRYASFISQSLRNLRALGAVGPLRRGWWSRPPCSKSLCPSVTGRARQLPASEDGAAGPASPGSLGLGALGWEGRLEGSHAAPMVAVTCCGARAGAPGALQSVPSVHRPAGVLTLGSKRRGAQCPSIRPSVPAGGREVPSGPPSQHTSIEHSAATQGCCLPHPCLGRDPPCWPVSRRPHCGRPLAPHGLLEAVWKSGRWSRLQGSGALGVQWVAVDPLGETYSDTMAAGPPAGGQPALWARQRHPCESCSSYLLCASV